MPSWSELRNLNLIIFSLLLFFTSSPSPISFTILCGFWFSQSGHPKPCYSAPVLSSFSDSSFIPLHTLSNQRIYLLI
jgi:hypothetical protein